MIISVMEKNDAGAGNGVVILDRVPGKGLLRKWHLNQ